MICTTIRDGKECPFMTAKGCSYNGGICHEIVEQCSGCNRSIEYKTGWYCSAYPDPTMKWKVGNCNMATHTKATNKTAMRTIAHASGTLPPVPASITALDPFNISPIITARFTTAIAPYRMPTLRL